MRKVLIIEDDINIAGALCTLMHQENLRSEFAENGVRGLELLKGKDKPDVILLDMIMPVMDGFEFIERKLEIPEIANIPVIVLTALPKLKNNKGIFKHITKPFDTNVLMDSIESAFE